MNKPNPFLLGFVKVTGYPAALAFFKPKLFCEDDADRRLPKPAILMSNHTSLMDFVLWLCVFPFRTMRFLMAEVLFNKGKLFSFLLYSLGGIRVDRDARDFGFVGESLETLGRGGTIGVFPEGRLPVNGVHFPFKPSIVYIALRTNAPIIPVFTDGNYGLFKRAHAIIGRPLNISDYLVEGEPESAALDRLTKILEEKTYALGEELARRVADGGKAERHNDKNK